MDERDLFLLPEAGKAEAHAISTDAHSTSQSPTQKQGDIESHSFHDLESKLEEEEADNFNLLGLSSSPNPPTESQQEPQTEPSDYDELISFGDNEIHSAKQATPVKEEQEEEKETEHMEHEHYSPSSPTMDERDHETIHEEETHHPDSVTDQDTLSNLPSESVPEPHHGPEKTSSIPESSSVTGMRDLSDQEESTYERKGPLTIPASAMTSPKQETQAKNDTQDSTEMAMEDEDLAKSHNWPRPPTPPKELSEPEEEKPSVVDLGPPPHPHHLTHRSSEKGLQSILKKTGPWIDFTHVDPKARNSTTA